MDFLVGSGRLSAELVAWDVKDFQAFVVVIQVQLFDGRILRGESAAGSGIDHQHDLSLIVCHFYSFAVHRSQREVIKRGHGFCSFRFCGGFLRFAVAGMKEKRRKGGNSCQQNCIEFGARCFPHDGWFLFPLVCLIVRFSKRLGYL